MVKDVESSTNAIWGVGVCLNVCVCVCRVSYRILGGGGGTPKFSVNLEEVYSTKQLGGLGDMLLQNLLKK